MTSKFSLPLGLALMVAGPSQLFAQTTKTPIARATAKATTATVGATTVAADAVAARADALTNNMSQALSLTPAQTEKVRAINLTSIRNVETARQRYSQDPAKLKGYIDDVSLARLDRIKEVLTPVQFARYQQKREEKMGIPTIRGNQGTPPPGLPSNRGEE
jgi:hypothetical protein